MADEKEYYKQQGELVGKQIQSIPKPDPNIGIDTKQTVYSNMVGEGINSVVNTSAFDNFTTAAMSRNQLYKMLDDMCMDTTIAAVLETYAEDATETSETGEIVWAESDDPEALKYVSYLLDSMRINKYIYRWVHSLCKYGDLYVQLYRESDYDDGLFNEEQRKKTADIEDKLNKNKRAYLAEDVKVKAYKKNDHFVHYVEMVDNPSSIFELTKFGKTYAYVEAESKDTNASTDSTAFRPTYRFNRKDVILHGPMDYVHACLEDNTSRTPEEITIFQTDDTDATKVKEYTYKVKRGQSLLYNVFKIWRQLNLLENAVLLNRITKTSVLRVIGVEVGDMAKEDIGPHLQRIKQLMEQKQALDAGNNITEYTNPGPAENNIYIPTKEGIGAISTSQIGGDVNVGKLEDISHFQDKLFGGLRVPKQFFGITDDNAGFSGGQSLSIISARYAKMIKRIQNTIIQLITDIINLILIDSDMPNWINKFTIKMVPPITQDEIDRRENKASNIQVINDTMQLLTDVSDSTVKLKIIKALLSNVIDDVDVISLLQEEIEKIEKEEEKEVTPETEDVPPEQMPLGGNHPASDLGSELGLEPMNNPEEQSTEESGGEPEEESGEPALPTPEELNAGDLSDSTNTNI